ncbi:MAG: hypothetical protein V4584_07410 [Verrucomicrobiota bacterium]
MTRMKATSILHLSTFALLCFFTSSCVTYTKYHDEPRRKVSFSSTSAAQTFYDAYASVDTPYGNGSLSATITLPYWQLKKDTESIKFNAAIQIADTNHDNLISEKEARSYAEAIAADRKQKWEDQKF